MATLTLETTFIAPVSDLTATVDLGQYSELATNGGRSEVRMYARGRRRVVSRPGAALEVAVGYRYITRADYVALLDLVGVLVLFRDQRERQVFGLLGDVSGKESPANPDFIDDVSFAITEVTYSEVV